MVISKDKNMEGLRLKSHDDFVMITMIKNGRVERVDSPGEGGQQRRVGLNAMQGDIKIGKIIKVLQSSERNLNAMQGDVKIGKILKVLQS